MSSPLHPDPSYDNEAEFIKLADELEATQDGKYTQVIWRLRNNWYHDFKNPDEVPTPKMLMIGDFARVGRQDIVTRIKDGDFDQ